MNIVPCSAWIPRGVSKARPDKVALTKDELKQLIAPNNDNDRMNEDQHDENEDIVQRYGLDKYDDENDLPNMDNQLTGLAVYVDSKEDPYIDPDHESESESEREDFEIKPTDNLVAIGHVDEDCAILEFYVFNQEADDLYVHHDIVIPAYPLCIEWLDFEPSDPSSRGNYVAVGDMTSCINVWDVDVVDTLEPAFVLGTPAASLEDVENIGKKTKKKKVKQEDNVGHSDAVLSVSWNRIQRNHLASGSADHKIIVWDLSICAPIVTIDSHPEKVQSVQWHPFEVNTLLSGSCAGTLIVGDVFKSNEAKTWRVDGEIEKALWNHFDGATFFACTDVGMVYGFNRNADAPLFAVSAHPDGVSGMTLSTSCPGLLVTISTKKHLKVWDVADMKPKPVGELKTKLNALLSVTACVDDPFVVALGGDSPSKPFSVIRLQSQVSGMDYFNGRELRKPQYPTPISIVGNAPSDMEVDQASTSKC